MPDAVEDHQLRNTATIRAMRGSLDSHGLSTSSWHPLLLPLAPDSGAIVDYSTLEVYLPLELSETGTPLEQMLRPLADLCQTDLSLQRPVPWVYEWYYFELLDGDEVLRPLCWIDSELLFRFFPDHRPGKVIMGWVPEEWGPEEDAGPRDVPYGRQETGDDRQHGGGLIYAPILERPAYPHQLWQMDYIAQLPPGSDSDLEERQEWWTWMVHTWRQNEERWLAEGLLTYGSVRPWLSQLRFDQALAEETPVPEWGGVESGVRLWKHFSRAGDLGLFWQMIPLYDTRSLDLIWQAMQQELYQTSVFNPQAKPRQNPALWRDLEERFALQYRRMSEYWHKIRLREHRVLEWTRQGKGLQDIANLLISEGLHPLRKYWGDEEGANLESAHRVAVRIRRRLRERGLIERGKSGRPRKA